MYQKTILIGNLGQDPELRQTPSGDAVCSVNIAVNKARTSDDGQRNEKTTWFRVTFWRRNAENVAKFLKKGSRVLVEGEIEEARVFTDREGNSRASLELTATTVKFLSGNEAAKTEGASADLDIPF